MIFSCMASTHLTKNRCFFRTTNALPVEDGPNARKTPVASLIIALGHQAVVRLGETLAKEKLKFFFHPIFLES
jgi:hypothetical protein